jgi:AcrR family transcriptional regulator
MASDTKKLILDVAERLFADRGFSATSLRELTSEAGTNVASVNYHFGSKEALLAAVLERRLRPINERRLDILDKLEHTAGEHPLNLEDVLRAFLTPPFHKRREWGEGGRNFMRLMGRIHSETNKEFRASFIRQFDTVFRRFIVALRRSLPHLDDADVSWRMLFLVGSMAFTMTWAESMPLVDREASRDPEELLESLVQFGAAGMAATTRAPVAVGKENVRG